MLSYPRAVRAFSAVNVAGQINHRLCTRDGWARPIEQGLTRHIDSYGWAPRAAHAQPRAAPSFAVSFDRGRLSGAYVMAELPRFLRYPWSLSGWAMVDAHVTLTGAAAFIPCLLLFPWLEALGGRGHLLNLRPSDLVERAPGDGQARLDRHLHFGLAGYLLEWPFVALAQMNQKQRRPALAAACLYAAVAGRVLLQPIRLVACAACLMITLSAAVLTGLFVVAADAASGTLHALCAQFAPPTADGPEHDGPFEMFDTIARRVLERRVLENTLPSNSIRATPKGDVSAQVRAFMSIRLRDFARVPDGNEVEANIVVAEVRDSIVERLADFCLDLPDREGYRWGISQLNSYLAMSHDEAFCIADT